MQPSSFGSEHEIPYPRPTMNRTRTILRIAPFLFLYACSDDESSPPDEASESAESSEESESTGGGVEPDAAPAEETSATSTSEATASTEGDARDTATSSDVTSSASLPPLETATSEPPSSETPAASCVETYDCYAACETDECIEACAASTDEVTAVEAYYLYYCATVSQCETVECIVDYCPSELVACVDTPDQPDGGTPQAEECPEPTGPGTEHAGFIQSDEVWSAADSPHIITHHVEVRGATLTIEPCATVVVNEGYYISVGETSGNPALLVAKGEVQEDIVRPVVFKAASDSVWWAGLAAVTTGFLELEYAVVSRAGHANGPGVGHPSAITAYGNDNRTEVIPNVSLKHVVIDDSANLGLSAMASGGFTDDSTDVIVSNAGSQGGRSSDIQTTHAAYLEAPAIHTLPAGSYEGNTVDAILAKAPFTLATDETFLNRGVPYQIVSWFHMVPPNAEPTTLTLEPGVTLQFGGEDFQENIGLVLGDQGKPVRLIADGTQDAPITFTSGASTPAAGAWSGVTWDDAPSVGNVMNYVTLEYGGGESGANGFGCGPGDNDSLLFLAWEPQEAFIQNCTFRESASGAIVSAWQSDAAGPDLSSPNTFEAIANGCSVSVHKDANGVCQDDSGSDCY